MTEPTRPPPTCHGILGFTNQTEYSLHCFHCYEWPGSIKAQAAKGELTCPWCGLLQRLVNFMTGPKPVRDDEIRYIESRCALATLHCLSCECSWTMNGKTEEDLMGQEIHCPECGAKRPATDKPTRHKKQQTPPKATDR